MIILDYYLKDIYESAKRQASSAIVRSTDPPKKDILRALSSDDSRFANTGNMIRAILYSDMAQNSDIGSVFQQQTSSISYGDTLGSYLRHSVFYVFGVGSDVAEDPKFQESARSFWAAALKSMASSLRGFGADLNVPNSVPISSQALSIEFTDMGQPVGGRLLLLVDNEGNLVDSYLFIDRLGSSALSGRYRCRGSGVNSQCTLDASTDGLATTRPNEPLLLQGSIDTGYRGEYGFKGTGAYFSVKAKAIEN
jgi:hypothetical protein